MSNILLTGGRAPATLELSRAFHRAGHTVFMAESLRGHLSQPSNSITKNFLVPAPRQETAAFIRALNRVIAGNRIDLLVPTCEEIFYISKHREELDCRVFVESIEKLDALHNKWNFFLKAAEHGLPMPRTMLVTSQSDLTEVFSTWDKLVLKPAYSRFAARTLILPTLEQALDVLKTSTSLPMIAQEYIDGMEICTYTICHDGHISAHTTYRSTFTAGRTGTLLLEHVDHPMIFEWVRRFVDAIKFTGQIAFDFIETAGKRIFAIECNPHANGVATALLASCPGFASSFFNRSMKFITPDSGLPVMLLTGMLIYGLPESLRKRELLKWVGALFASRDIVFRMDDPLPGLLQFRSLFHYLGFSYKHGISLLDASMFDIEWNGFTSLSPETS